MLTYQDFDMPDQLGKCLDMTVGDIISTINKFNKTCYVFTLKCKQMQIDVNPKISVTLDVVNNDTIKFTIVEHEVILHNNMSSISYLSTLRDNHDIEELMSLAYPLAVTLKTLTM